jgi:UDP-glucose 4-epimerase
MTMIADASRIRTTLNWTPQFDNLETIASHALAWEEKLEQQRRQRSKSAVPA